MRVKSVVILWSLVVLLFYVQPAQAVEVELWPETFFQVQQYRDVDQLKIDETRFTQYLTLNLYQTLDPQEFYKQAEHAFFSSMRVDVDLGRDHSPDEPSNALEGQRFALLYAYWEWRRIGDALDLALGRQVLTDEFGMAAMDGLRMTIRRDWYVGLELYVGSEVKGEVIPDAGGFSLPNSDTFEPDGLTDDDRWTGLFGAALFLDGLENTVLRLHYRHRYSGETDSMQLGLSFRQRILDVWELYSMDSFDLIQERFSELRFGTTVDFDWVGFSLEHWSGRAEFDADSIFNFFDVNSEKEISARFYIRPDSRTHIGASYARLFQGGGGILFDDWGDDGNASHMGSLYVNRMLGDIADVRANYRFTRGYGGDTQRFSVGGGVDLWQRRIRLDGDFMGSFYSRLTYNDILVENGNSGFSWGLSLRSEFRIHPEVTLAFRGDGYSNPIIERQFAFFFELDVHTWQ